MALPARASWNYFTGLALGALLASSFAASCSDSDHPIDRGGAGALPGGPGGEAGNGEDAGSSGDGGMGATTGGSEAQGGSSGGGQANSGGTSGGGTSGGGTSGGGTSGGGTSGAGTSGAGTSGSSGTSGAGTSGAGTSGSGGSDCPSALCTTRYLTENCGPSCKAITSAQCLTCEAETGCDSFPCSALTTNSEGGSAAPGTPRAALCNELLSCLRATRCANGAFALANANPGVVTGCYCGSVGFAACESGNANGPCHLQFERALETNDKAVMVTRLGDLKYAGYNPVNRIGCDVSECPVDGCFGTPP